MAQTWLFQQLLRLSVVLIVVAPPSTVGRCNDMVRKGDRDMVVSMILVRSSVPH